MKIYIALTIILAFLLVYFSANAHDALTETRYVQIIKRDMNGNILRRADVLRAFQKAHPCPSTGLTTGACAGWHKNHVIPLACGGSDSVSNMQWLPVQVKNCKAWYCIDRFERKIYDNGVFGSDACNNLILKAQ